MPKWEEVGRDGQQGGEGALSSFLGSFTVSIDEKGRIPLPPGIRAGLPASSDGTLVITRGLDGCYDGYPPDEWARRLQKLRSIPDRRSGRYFRRRIVGEAALCKMDKRNRILLPQEVIRDLGVKESLLIIGHIDHIEFWSPAAYDSYVGSQQASLEDILEDLDQMNSNPGSHNGL
jgi:MraZ protein